MRRLLAAVAAGCVLAACGEIAPLPTVPSAMTGAVAVPAGTASAVTGAPGNLIDINTHHDLLLRSDSSFRFGTQADPATVTLGPADGVEPSWPNPRPPPGGVDQEDEGLRSLRSPEPCGPGTDPNGAAAVGSAGEWCQRGKYLFPVLDEGLPAHRR